MYKLIKGKDIPTKDAAAFIAKWNKNRKHHIGFCGTEADEIIETIDEEMTDVTFGNCFAAAIQDGQLVGLIGLDIDLEDKSAEVWGPFVDPAFDVDMAIEIWGLLNEQTQSLETISLFFNKENNLVKKFADKLEFKQKTDQIILTYSEDQLENQLIKKKEELASNDNDAFAVLHDNAFPGTYYSGKEIMERINDTQKVFVLKDKGHLAGYVYVEADPDFADGSIEFIAVDQAFRGKGYGKKLLLTAVSWLFTFESIKEITLCVSADNKGAIGLYQSAGFHLMHELYYFSKNSVAIGS
ncbi:GNAT family N-acetyltransferase [Virgibacillus oceani]|uniref:N-acetyltransferase n=1 Tax=Virgibacillus oceani TaxID=1479511 RepID=A0A917HKA2_9BACI|nr:GNAT family N-acetyltransferase [Virgibacillus oceani]GGG81375.1 N-acetyltransferase [Virgibacillus oceani]